MKDLKRTSTKKASASTPPAAVQQRNAVEPSPPAELPRVPTGAGLATPAPVRTVSVERFNALFDQWMGWPPETIAPICLPPGMIRVEEYRDDGVRVIRAELPGIDPERDVELFVADGMLCIDAERREEETSDETGYVRYEFRAAAFNRVLPLGDGVTAADITSSYKDGVLEVRVPEANPAEARRIPISTA